MINSEMDNQFLGEFSFLETIAFGLHFYPGMCLSLPQKDYVCGEIFNWFCGDRLLPRFNFNLRVQPSFKKFSEFAVTEKWSKTILRFVVGLAETEGFSFIRSHHGSSTPSSFINSDPAKTFLGLFFFFPM